MTGRTDERAARPGEFELISKLFVPLAKGAPGALGLSDDAAVMAHAPGEEFVVTTDAVVEGVDFLRNDPPGDIARKALRVNLSDLAAKGANPSGYLLTLLLPAWPDLPWLEAFAAGLADDQGQFGMCLLGGDMSGTPGPLSVSVAMFGKLPKGSMIRRCGAEPGDLVFVSGTIGDSGAGLSLLTGQVHGKALEDTRFLERRYRRPEPRLALGQALKGIASAALDVSDGLVADLGHIAAASRVRIHIDEAAIPLSSAFVGLFGAGAGGRRRAAVSGDDYEIAFTAKPAQTAAIQAVARSTAIPVHPLGRVLEGEGVALLDAQGRVVPLEKTGFVHF